MAEHAAGGAVSSGMRLTNAETMDAAQRPGLGSGDEAKVEWSQLQLGKVIGSGTSGVCYRGTFAGTPVAIKVLHPQSVTEADLAGLVNECRLMLRLRHPHAQHAGVENSAADARATVSGAWARLVGRTGLS